MRWLLCTLLLTWLVGSSSPALAQQADELPPTLWPDGGRVACPSLRPCCVPGQEVCVDPGLSRALLAGAGTLGVAAGGTTFMVTGDSLSAGDPQGALMGVGFVGLSGAALGAVAEALTPGPPTPVDDRPSRPWVRLAWSPGGSSVQGQTVPQGLGLRLDPSLDLGHGLELQPHLGGSLDLGEHTYVDPGVPGVQSSETFPVVLRTFSRQLSAAAELSWALPSPLLRRHPLYAGALELRYRPTWELRRRTLHPGEDRQQVVEHMAAYPLNLGLRWHLSPRQRYTVYLGPRVDWVGYTEPGGDDLLRGSATVGSFYGEAWWQLDLPLGTTRGGTRATGRLNLGYIHSNLDGQRLDASAVVGYFGPVELSFDLRLRRQGGSAIQLTSGYRVATGGGAFVELGWIPARREE